MDRENCVYNREGEHLTFSSGQIVRNFELTTCGMRILVKVINSKVIYKNEFIKYIRVICQCKEQL